MFKGYNLSGKNLEESFFKKPSVLYRELRLAFLSEKEARAEIKNAYSLFGRLTLYPMFIEDSLKSGNVKGLSSLKENVKFQKDVFFDQINFFLERGLML